MTATNAPESWVLERLDPRRILTGKDDERGRFFLTLALVFNDLKGLSRVAALVKADHGALTPVSERISAEGGEHNGLQLQLTRYAVGVLHELMVFLERHQEIVESPPVQRLAREMPPQARESWKAIVDVALKRDRREVDVRGLLVWVRNNVGFHYYQPKPLAEGFETFFAEGSALPESEAAYVATGSTMEFSRFFYADAAAQTATLGRARETGAADFPGLVRELAMDVNRALRFLVVGFIRERTGTKLPGGGRGA